MGGTQSYEAMPDERQALLHTPTTWPSQETTQRGDNDDGNKGVDHHAQFCHLVGVKPFHLPPGSKHQPPPESLYMRARNQLSSQSRTYIFSATLINTLLLSQVVLGAALTGLGASDSSRVLITVFGAANTVIAGMIAFLKSRGQPMRARMFRDDLERVVDEIENSAVMWLGISRNVHGYDAIDTDEAVTVRSEVARLTRLYDRAVKQNTVNDPDFYNLSQGFDSTHATLRKPGQPMPAGVEQPSAPAPAQAAVPDSTAAPVGPTAGDSQPAGTPPEDVSPAVKPPEPSKEPETAPAPPAQENASPDPAPRQKGEKPPKYYPPHRSFKDTTSTDPPAPTYSTVAGATGEAYHADAVSPTQHTKEPVEIDTTGSARNWRVDPDESPATTVHPYKPKKDNWKAKNRKGKEKWDASQSETWSRSGSQSGRSWSQVGSGNGNANANENLSMW